MSSVLSGGLVATPRATLEPLDVTIAHGRIVALEPHRARTRSSLDPSAVIDVDRHIVAPGLIDLQINGGWGRDFTGDPSAIAEVGRQLPSTGVTSFVPTIVSSSTVRRTSAIEAYADLTPDPTAATALGLHFEGPVISPSRAGAHNTDHIGLPPADELKAWVRERGILIVTLAPEVPGALELTTRLCAAGVIVSVGHTMCSPEQFAAARAAGATMVTHLFNAMAPFSHRDPGPIGSALADDQVHASIICDGIHVDPVAVRMVWQAIGPERLVLVTDAVAALGHEAAALRLGDRTVTVSDRGVRTADDVLAGSNLSLDQAVRNLIAFAGCSPTHAIQTATGTPAGILGLADRGRVEVGARADLVVFDADLNVVRTIIGGTTAWKS